MERLPRFLLGRIDLGRRQFTLRLLRLHLQCLGKSLPGGRFQCIDVQVVIQAPQVRSRHISKAACSWGHQRLIPTWCTNGSSFQGTNRRRGPPRSHGRPSANGHGTTNHVQVHAPSGRNQLQGSIEAWEVHSGALWLGILEDLLDIGFGEALVHEEAGPANVGKACSIDVLAAASEGFECLAQLLLVGHHTAAQHRIWRSGRLLSVHGRGDR
mmetsp:Transcript_32093/g.70209  ORF Transcript_32093/g.70209 Transcript_32093/m.70209 type:complete len:212 (-) Transcript_32093:383-1018(-)